MLSTPDAERPPEKRKKAAPLAAEHQDPSDEKKPKEEEEDEAEEAEQKDTDEKAASAASATAGVSAMPPPPPPVSTSSGSHAASASRGFVLPLPDAVTAALSKQLEKNGETQLPVQQPQNLVCWLQLLRFSEGVGHLKSIDELDEHKNQFKSRMSTTQQFKDSIVKAAQKVVSHLENRKRESERAASKVAKQKEGGRGLCQVESKDCRQGHPRMRSGSCTTSSRLTPANSPVPPCQCLPHQAAGAAGKQSNTTASSHRCLACSSSKTIGFSLRRSRWRSPHMEANTSHRSHVLSSAGHSCQ